MSNGSQDRIEDRKVETYARALLEAAKSEDRVQEDLAPLEAVADAGSEVLSLLATMATHGDLAILPSVAEAYREMVDGSDEVVGVDVTTAVALDDELRELITKKCEADLGGKVFLIEHVDPSIIGGVVLSARGQRRDASVRTQLETARRIMTENVKKTEV